MMRERRFERWQLIAVIAICVAVVLLLIPHSGDSTTYLALLPLLFFGIISPCSLFPQLADSYPGRAPNAPVLPASFQRPPPFACA